MHGTFRAHVESGSVLAVRFHAPATALPERKGLRMGALLLAGCCVAVLSQAAPWPGPNAGAVIAPRASQAVAPRPARAPTPPLRLQPAAAREAVSRARHTRLPPIEPLDPVFVTLPDPAPAAPIPAFSAEPLPAPPLVVDLPAPSSPPPTVADETPRPVDIAQISESDVPSLRVPQLHEPGLAVGGEPTLGARIAAMQVTPLPPVRYPESERAVLLAEAPTQMIVRIGGAQVGKVDFQVTDGRTIGVKLGGLLDLLAGHYDAGEFARLRNSTAADAYVSFDKLRAMGLNVRYDPFYDEVRIAG
jgi:hypothetical protein